MGKWIFLISIAALFGCKKVMHDNPGGNNSQQAELKMFSVRVVDTTATGASVAWTPATDSSTVNSVTYSVILDGDLVAKKQKALTYKFSGLIPNTGYTLTVRAYNSRNDSSSSTIVFITKDIYLKFVRKILPANNQVWGFAISPDKGYICSYNGSSDTLFLGDGKPSTRAFHVLKMDSLGNAVWTKRFSSPNTDIGYMIKTISDGYLILGYNFMIKIDFNGNTLWQNVFDTKGVLRLNSFVEMQDKSIVISGVQSGQPPAILMISLGPGGNIKWQKTYAVAQQSVNIADLVEIPQDNSLILLGEYGSKFGLWKMDGGGNLVWQKSFGDTMTSSTAGQIRYTGSQLLVSGTSAGNNYTYQVKMYRLDVNGNILNKILIESLYSSGSMQWFEFTKDGGYVVLTRAYGGSNGGYNEMFKFDQNDKEQWENTYNEFSTGKVVKQTSDGGYVFLPFDPSSSTPLLVRTNNVGKYQ